MDKKNSFFWTSRIDWCELILIILPLSIFLIFAVINIGNLDIDDKYKWFLSGCFIIPALFFYFEFLSRIIKAKREFFRKKRIKHFSLFFTLLIFYATFSISLLIFSEKPPEGEIPYLKDGTIGMRSWHCRVKISDIKIHYNDSLGVWRLMPDSIIYKENNWSKCTWNLDKLKDQINKIEIQDRDNNLNEIKDTVYLDKDTLIIQNCVLIFSPKGNTQKTFHNIRFRCNVTFDQVNNPIDSLYPGFQLITFIDTTIFINENGKKDFSDLCLQFNLGMNNDHHPWIPGIDYEPATKYVSSIKRHKMFGDFNTMEKNKKYSISAIILNDKALFLGHTNGTVTLFEAQLAKYK